MKESDAWRMAHIHTSASADGAWSRDSRAARLAPWFLVVCAVLWSTSGLFIKLIEWRPLSILCLRSLFAMPVLLVFLAITRRQGGPVPRLFGRLTRFEVLGAVCYVATQFTFVTATKLTTAANAIFLQYTAPLYVLLFGWLFLRERPRRADWVTMPLIFAGLLLFLGQGFSTGGTAGNILGVISGVTLAGTMVFTRGQPGLPVRTFLLGMVAGIAIGLPSLLGETFTTEAVVKVAYLGIFQMGLALVFYSLGVRYVPALEATLILALEPVLNPLWVFLVTGEAPGSLALAGGVLVVVAVIARALIGAAESAAGQDPAGAGRDPAAAGPGAL